MRIREIKKTEIASIAAGDSGSTLSESAVAKSHLIRWAKFSIAAEVIGILPS